MDNFEWSHGYEERFGMHYVNFSDPNRTRVPKQSAAFYRETILRNGFPKNPIPKPDDRFADEFLYGSFPENFAWSVATASYQVEGGWNEDGTLINFTIAISFFCAMKSSLTFVN